MNKRKKLIVIGGGAAGFFCAINAARSCNDLDVMILEKTTKLLTKVKVSGGGRCNVTHQSEAVEDMIDAYPRGKYFVKKTLHQFSSSDTITWFNDRGVKIKEEPDGRMFPESDQSQTIIDCLMMEAEKYGVSIKTKAEVTSVSKGNEFFEIAITDEHKKDSIYQANYLCIAVGGYPKENGFEWLRQLGLGIVPPVPSLFTFNIPDKNLHQLMGVSNKDTIVKVTKLKMQEDGPVLITHWGLSGPAILKLSSRAARELHEMNYSFEIVLNWVPSFHESAMLENLKTYKTLNTRQYIHSKNPFELTSRLWNYLLGKAGVTQETTWANIPQALMVKLSKTLCGDTYQVEGKTTFKEEFVTAGGIRLDEIDPATMQSKKIPGLFFAGEVMDVDGVTGGYNFQHAWSSGWIAANAICNLVK